MTRSLEVVAGKVGLVINTTNTKIMAVGKWNSTEKITIGADEIDACEECATWAAPSTGKEEVTGKS